MVDQNPEQITAKTQMLQVEKILDEYEKGLGLPEFNESHEDDTVKSYLTMQRSQLEKLTPEDCAEIAIIMDSFAFYLQQALNRETARVGWASSRLKEMMAGRESQYTGSWDSQFHQAVKGNDFARGLLQIQRYAQQRVDRITYLATSIKSRSGLFMNLQRAKGMR
jgi:hypothetical protein